MIKEDDNSPVSEGRNGLHGAYGVGEGGDLENPIPDDPGTPRDTAIFRHFDEAPPVERRRLNLKNTYYVAALAYLALQFLGVGDVAAEHFMNFVDSFLLQ